MKILICCSAGLSSNLLVDKMKVYIKENNLDHKVASSSISNLKRYIDECDMVLLAPQISYSYEYINNLCHIYNIPIRKIGRDEFGVLDVETILFNALTSYRKKQMEESKMNSKIEQTIERFLVPVAQKMSSSKLLTAISGGFMKVLPITIAGSIITLIANFPIDAWISFLTNSGIADLLTICSNATLGVIALYTVIFIAYTYAKEYGADGVSAAIISLASFIVLTPMTTTVTSSSGEVVNVVSVLPLAWLGSAGLFTAMVVALLSTRIYIFIVKKNLKIKMPETVPSNISKPFEALIPAMIVFVIMLVINYTFNLTEYGSIHQCIYSLIQVPLQGFTANFWVVCIISPLLMAILWFFGLHAGQILVFPILMPLLMPASLANLSAYQAGSTLPNIITYESLFIGQGLGGVGNTIALCICMLFFAKSRRYKMLGKMGIAPALFCINEPIIFGTPIVMNPMLLIPFILAPIVTAIITYFSMAIGLVPFVAGLQLPWTTPILLFGFLECGIQGAILQVILILISIAIYYPFFKVVDRKALKDEVELEEERMEKIDEAI